jgi:hypothetical protein
MKIINAKTAANIAERVVIERQETARAKAELDLRETIMPCIAESAEDGKRALLMTVELSSDLYENRYLIAGLLRDLGYKVELKDEKDFSIKW